MILNVFIIIIITIVAFLWIASFVFYLKSGWSGVKNWIYLLISWAVIIGILWWVLVKPTIGCTGFLCGLEEVLKFLGLAILAGLILGLIVYRRSRVMADKNSDKKDGELLDDTF